MVRVLILFLLVSSSAYGMKCDVFSAKQELIANPDSAFAWLEYAQTELYTSTNGRSSAIRRALWLRPYHIRLVRSLLSVAIARHHWALAAELVRHGFTHFPKDPTFILRSMEVMRAQGQLETARAFADLLPPEAQTSRYFEVLMEVQFGLTHYLEALGTLNEALKRWPTHQKFLYNKGLVLEALNRKREAYDVYEQILNGEKGDHSYFYTYAAMRRAYGFFAEKKLGAAIDVLYNVLGVYPESLNVRLQLQSYLLMADRLHEMDVLSKQTVALFPSCSSPLTAHAQGYKKKGDSEQALKNCYRALKIANGHGVVEWGIINSLKDGASK